MATIFRDPTYAQQQRKPAQPSVFWTTGLLVPALLLSGSVPFKTPTPQVTPQHPSHALSANPDTSRGIPKTLYADASKALFVPPHLTEHHPRRNGQLNVDTSRGTAKVLYADAVRPTFNPQHTAPDRPRPVADTTNDTPLTLLTTAFVQPPLVNAPTLAVERPRQNSDTSRSVAPGALLAPFVNPPHWASPDFFWQPADTSTGLPKVATSDAAVPFFNAPSMQIDRLRPVVDTSSAWPKVLYADQVAPFFNAPFLAADRIRPVTDTSRGFNPPPGLPPFVQTDWPSPIAFRHLQLHGWDQQANPATIPPAPPPSAVFPAPGQVLLGVVYGPNGTDYTGTLVVTSGSGVYLRRR